MPKSICQVADNRLFKPSWPGLSRPSTSLSSSQPLKSWMPGTRPGMTNKRIRDSARATAPRQAAALPPNSLSAHQKQSLIVNHIEPSNPPPALPSASRTAGGYLLPHWAVNPCPVGGGFLPTFALTLPKLTLR